eukprot:TRINITY_DN14148_c0_g1_i3.p1 TRINITY_DN14148_c0_g1~~TRINITY_DN14148_c0_g1_i3.p1  ORF type:complete len:547 (+),score=95.21 TRINITY_DN14148_c0_g1_i3:354-1994(+)
MHMVTQRLLCILPEEHAFWMLSMFYEDLFPGHDETKEYGKHAVKGLMMDLIDQLLPEFMDLLVGADLDLSDDDLESWDFNTMDFQSRVLENWANNFFLSFGAVHAPSETLWLIWDILLVIGPHMFFSIGLAFISLSLRLIEEPSVQAELRTHTDPFERLKYVSQDLMESVCELLHDPSELLLEIDRWSQHPQLQKEEIEPAKHEQMQLMQARELMCAASRKPGDGFQKEARESDGSPLCPFCEKTFDGRSGGSPCSEMSIDHWFDNLDRVSTDVNKLVTLNGTSRSALHVAVDATNRRFVEFVLRHKHKFSLNLEVKELPSGRTALIKSIWNPEAWKLIPDLIQAGAQAGTSDADGFSTLHAAAITGLPRGLAEVLLSKSREGEMHALVGMRTTADYSALHLAALHDRHELCELLLQQEPPEGCVAAPHANVNEIVHPGQQTAMHLAAGKGHLRVCEVLLRHPDYQQAPAVHAWLPIHVATYWGHEQVLLSILLHVKDGEAQNAVECTVESEEEGLTALRIATIRQHQPCAEIIRTFTNPSNLPTV